MNTVKRGDTHEIVFTIRDEEGELVDLDGANVRLLAKRMGTKDTIVMDAEVGEDPGTVVHTLTGTLVAGGYRLEVEMTKGGAIATIPSDGYFTLKVVADLG